MRRKIDPLPKAKGRLPRHLLSGIAVCGACGAPTRVGSQNVRPGGLGAGTKPERYRVYECAGLPGQSGFHVSISQEQLDEIVSEAVIARVEEASFRVPFSEAGLEEDSERQELRLNIKSKRLWLREVAEEAELTNNPDMLAMAEKVTLPKIWADRDRLEKLEELDPFIVDLHKARSIRLTWERLPIAQQRHIVQTLLIPRIDPVPTEARGRQDVNQSRVQLLWKGEDE